MKNFHAPATSGRSRRVVQTLLAALIFTGVAVLTATSASAQEADSDRDRVADSVDNCPEVRNRGQRDLDGDGIGNRCDSDIDGDNVDNDIDAFPRDITRSADADGDRIDDSVDNCPNTRNRGQRDRDGDGVGNRCDPEPRNPDVPAAPEVPEFEQITLDQVPPEFIAASEILVEQEIGVFLGDLTSFTVVGAPSTVGLPTMAPDTAAVLDTTAVDTDLLTPGFALEPQVTTVSGGFTVQPLSEASVGSGFAYESANAASIYTLEPSTSTMFALPVAG